MKQKNIKLFQRKQIINDLQRIKTELRSIKYIVEDLKQKVNNNNGM